VLLVPDASPHAWPVTGPVAFDAFALVVVDMQVDFVEPGGWLERIGVRVASMQAVVEPIARLLEAARAAGACVVHTRQGNAADLSDLPPARRAVRGLRNDGDDVEQPGLARGSAGWQIVDALAPLPGELIVDKLGFSAFAGTALAADLRERGITALAICGVTTNVCVLATLYAAVDEGFDCVLVTDAVAADEPVITAQTVAVIRHEGMLFGARTTVEDLVRALRA